MNFWDEKFSATEYIYGETPNEFFKENIDRLEPGKILLPAEGEGRNAVYAAKKGWQVTAFDQSTIGRDKALKLAEKFNVIIDYHISDALEINFEKESFDAIGYTFLHLPEKTRQIFHSKLLPFLKKGGFIFCEVFSKKQINNESGGPPKIDLLYTKTDLEHDFLALTDLNIFEKEVFLSEGRHYGKADVLRVVGRK